MGKLDEITKSFSEKLKTILKEKGMSANKLAIAIGIDRASIGKYLKGESSPRLDTFLAICDVLRVQPNYFLGIKNSEEENTEKSENRQIIESLYCLSKNGLIAPFDNSYLSDRSYNYLLAIYTGTTTYQALVECLRFAGSEFTDDKVMCGKICDKYEKLLVKY